MSKKKDQTKELDTLDTREAHPNDAVTLDTGGEVSDVDTVETISFPVTLSNGNEVELEAIKNRDDLDFELLEHAERGNYATFFMGTLTLKSRTMLKLAGAKVRDYPTIAVEYGIAIGALNPEE